MMRSNVLRVMAGAALATAVAGCNCGGPSPEDCQGLTVTFQSPVEQAEVTSPFDAEVRGVNDRGEIYELGTATLTVAGADTQGTLNGSSATFAGVTSAPADSVTMTATVTKKGTQCAAVTASISVKVLDTTQPPRVTGVTFPQDANGDGILNNVELPANTKIIARVEAVNTALVSVRGLRGVEVVGGPVDFGAGTSADVTLSALPETDSAQYQLFFELSRGGAAVNNGTNNPQAVATISVQRAALTCANTTQSPMGPADDADAVATGFQLRATGTVDSTVTSSIFRIANVGASAPGTPVAGDVSGDITVPDQGDNTYRVVLEGRDANGNLCTAEKDVRVDLDPPTVAITSPAAAASVTTSPVAVQVTASGIEDGGQVCVYLQTTPGQQQCGAVTGGMATIMLPVAVNGAATIVAFGRDLAGNQSANATVDVTVALTTCALTWGTIQGAAATCPAFVNRLVNGQMTVTVTGNAACAGQTLNLDLDGTQVGSNTTGSYSFPVTDGMHTLSAAPAGGSAITCAVTVDTQTPLILNPGTPPSGPAIINVLQDSQPGTPGAQRLLSFRPASVPTGRIDVCVDQNLPGTSGACAGTAGWFVLQSNVTSPVGALTYPEGTYNMKLVVVATSTEESPSVPLLVDVTAPCVMPAGITLPQDSSADGNLNSAELGAGAPQLRFDVGCGGAATYDVRRSGGTTVYAPSGAVGTNPVTASLSQNITAEGDYTFFVRLVDAAGNTNTDTGPASPARKAMRIDTQAPACTINQPSKAGTLNLADVPGGMLSVEVGTSADVGANGVTLTVDAATQMATPNASFVATAAFAVTGTRTLAIGATCADGVGNTAAASRPTPIDLDAPTCSISSPTATTYGVNDILTTALVTGAEGQVLTVRSSLQGSALGTLTVGGGVASGTINYPNGTQTVTVDVSDAAGNACTASVANVIVNSTSCNLAMTSGFVGGGTVWQNRNNTTMTGATTGTATASVNTSNCGAGKTVTLRRTAPAAATIGTTTTNATGDASFAAVVLNDAEVYEIDIDNGAALLTTRGFSVDLVAPTVGTFTINGTTPAASAVFFVAQAGNRNVDTAVVNFFADQDGAADGQATFDVNGVTGASQGANNGLLEVMFKGAAVATRNVTTTPQNFSVPVNLPHNDSGALAIRVTDQAGNQTTSFSETATIDVIAPAAPVVTRNLTNARNATVNLSWGPVYDDGSTAASGATAGYDVRWTTDAVVPSGNQLATVADFFGSSSNRESDSAWSATTISRDLTLPPLNSYYIAVVARDEVGNHSTYSVPSAVSNPWTAIVIEAPATGSFGQSVLLEASLNGDSLNDLLVSAPTRASNVGSVYIYSGAAGFASTSTCGAGCQELQPPGGAPGLFGSDISSSGNVGDVDAVTPELKPDLVVGQQSFAHMVGASSVVAGRAVLYFGVGAPLTQLSTTNFIEFRGVDFAGRIGSVTRIIKDLDGDGLDEISLAAPFWNGNQGRIYIYKGRSRAGWVGLATSADQTTAAPYIAVSSTNATWVIDGPAPLLVTPAGNGFGQNRWGMMSLGDLDGDGESEFTLPMSRATINRLGLFSSATVAASLPATPLTMANAIQTLTQTVTTDNSFANGFGASVVGDLDVINATGKDLVTSFPGAVGGGTVLVYADLTAAGAAGGNPSLTVVGPLTFGFKVAAASVNTADGRPDLLVALGLTASNSAWMLYQSAGTFETSIGGATPAFQVSRFDGAALSGGTNTSLGRANALGDINGDALTDVVLGDDRANQVRIWR